MYHLTEGVGTPCTMTENLTRSPTQHFWSSMCSIVGGWGTEKYARKALIGCIIHINPTSF